MVLFVLLATALIVGGFIAVVAGMRGAKILGPGVAMMAATLVFYGLVALL